MWHLPPTSTPSTRRLHTGVYAATLWVFDKPEKEHNGLYATVLTVLGAFLSFASIFLNSETLVPVWKLTSVSGARHRVDGVEVDATILQNAPYNFGFHTGTSGSARRTSRR